jgi:hypothetical protein
MSVANVGGTAAPVDQHGIALTYSFSGAAAAPGAGAAVVASGTLPAGTYAIEITTLQYGTVDANGLNMYLAGPAIRNGVADSTKARLPSAATPITTVFERVTFDGATTVSIVALAAAGAGSVYAATVRLTQLA